MKTWYIADKKLLGLWTVLAEYVGTFLAPEIAEYDF